MKKSDLNEWLSVLSNAGVLVGIFFLVYEINQNTKAIESEIAWSHAGITTDLYTSESGNPELAELHIRFSSMSINEAELEHVRDDPDFFRYTQMHAARLNYWQARFITETSVQDRARLKATIKNQAAPETIQMIFLRTVEIGMLLPEFGEFLIETINEI